MFCEMFHGDPKWSVSSTFMNSMVILWQIWRIYCECYEKIVPILARILYIFLIYKNSQHIPPTFYFIFQKYMATLTILLKISDGLILRKFWLHAKPLKSEKKILSRPFRLPNFFYLVTLTLEFDLCWKQ